jgi:O-antigen/teichoic acid export membrane protein
MNFFPHTKQEWLSHLLFPFRAYVVIVPIWAVIQRYETFYVREEQMRAAGLILAGYAICVLVFIFAAVIQFIAHQRRSAWTSIAFAVGSFITLYFMLPMFALAK